MTFGEPTENTVAEPLGPLLPIPIVLTIAGSDSSGGAGVQADLKTFCAFGVYGASVLTALTAQNTRGVQSVNPVAPAFVLAQIDSVLADLDVRAIKTGMLASAAIVSAIAARLSGQPALCLVVDPVMIATSGDSLLEPQAVQAMRDLLMPLARLITPNLPEAACLLQAPEARSIADATEQGHALIALGARAVLMKGGHGVGVDVSDILIDGAETHVFTRPRLVTPHTHGTGCTLSAAITALLARGHSLVDAVDQAQSYVWHGLVSGRDLGVGQGTGPVDHLWALRRGRSL
jgi:hydroxymethylpyrimidine/phosphomethylpyrimidine kinase